MGEGGGVKEERETQKETQLYLRLATSNKIHIHQLYKRRKGRNHGKQFVKTVAARLMSSPTVVGSQFQQNVICLHTLSSIK